MSPAIIYFWGAFKNTGHNMWFRNESGMYEQFYNCSRKVPWSRKEMDVDFNQPPHEQIEGTGRVLRRNGWTFAQWWDRSGDNRYGSSAGIVVNLEPDVDTLLALGQTAFPDIFERFGYGVRL